MNAPGAVPEDHAARVVPPLPPSTTVEAGTPRFVGIGARAPNAADGKSTLMRILFFAQLRDVTGKAEIELARDELTTNALWTELMTAYPGLAPFRSVVRLARNQEYVGQDARFAETDEVALIPPVSGG